MYKSTQDKHDWMARTGSHSDRPVLHASMAPRKFGQFEEGRLAALRDEKVRLLALGSKTQLTQSQMRRIGVINLEMKRLNREASECSERELLWKAARDVFNEEQLHAFSNRLIELRMMSEGESQEAIAAVIAERNRK